MKRIICILITAVLVTGLCGCGSETAKFKNTYKKFLKAAKDADIEEFYSYTEASGNYLTGERKEEYDEKIRDISNKQFYQDVSNYLRWVSGNDNFSCDNGIDKLRIKEIEIGDIVDEGYQKKCPVRAHVLITADDKEYDLHIKTQFFTMNVDPDIWVIDV